MTGHGNYSHPTITSTSTRAIIVHPILSKGIAGDESRARLEEACGLATAIHLDIMHAETVSVPKPRPSTLLSKGLVERFEGCVAELEVVVVIINHTLSPGQQRTLERAWKTKVIDRTGLILEIFGERARTREGQLQVELAHLTYQRSRLVRSWTHLERQRGGSGFLGGPGETQIEIDRRLISERITYIKKDLKKVTRTRNLHRSARKRIPYPIVAFVGYTNAGKSTLFNNLTSAGVFAEDQLFATLDPTMRGLKLPSGRKIILSDTVGFVSDLPHELVAAFGATLEEVLEADVLVHVRDISHSETEEQKKDVDDVLARMGVGPLADTKRNAQQYIEAHNKVDLLDEVTRGQVERRVRKASQVVMLSGLTGEGINDLLLMIDKLISSGRCVLDVAIPFADGKTLAWLYRKGEVVARDDGEVETKLTVMLDPADVVRLESKQNTRILVRSPDYNG